MGMALGGGGKGSGPSPNINITPLVDVALVVLIIFMVVAPMLTKTFTLNVPPEPKDDKPPPAQTDDSVVLTIDESGAMKINKLAITKEELADRLPRMLAATRHKVLHFDAADGLPYGQGVMALDSCRDAGAKNIAIVTKKLPTH
ncbi:MAG: biopolymer transporter ExbD [Polyangiaceae bacterium]|nr:biopolymer transporter ExbD [Polyangiaceae bacterium]